jgi:hypothetical protein
VAIKAKTPFVILSLGMVAVVAVVLAVLSSRSHRGVTQEDFDRLAPGMTQAEVERLLDGPPRNDLRYSAIIWLPQATGKPISHEIDPVSPAFEIFSHEEKPKNRPQRVRSTSALDFFPQETAKDGHQAVWITSTGLIAVDFGPDGRLRQKYSSTIHEHVPPSLINWPAPRPKTSRRSRGF